MDNHIHLYLLCRNICQVLHTMYHASGHADHRPISGLPSCSMAVPQRQQAESDLDCRNYRGATVQLGLMTKMCFSCAARRDNHKVAFEVGKKEMPFVCSRKGQKSMEFLTPQESSFPRNWGRFCSLHLLNAAMLSLSLQCMSFYDSKTLIEITIQKE